MTTQKQIEANCQNAQFSTGPISADGKVIVMTNAIKHGIFTKGLIVSSEIGHESEAEYQTLLDNLIECLLPSNQMESLIVEKIAVDFWRLRRTIRFETGSIVKHIEILVKDFYSLGYKKDNQTIDRDIQDNQQVIEWNIEYIEYLSQGRVSFDEPVWKEGGFESDIIDDLYRVAKSIDILSEKDKKLIYGPNCLSIEELHIILQKNGYNDCRVISAKMIEICTYQNNRLEKENVKLAQQKASNDAADKLTYMLGMTPSVDNTDKVLKYERSLQKSIYQNLIMLKKLQGIF